MSSSTNPSTLDNLMLQTLMGRLSLRPPPSTTANRHPSFLSQSLEDLLLDAATNHLLSDDDDSGSDDNKLTSSSASKSLLSKEESKLEKEIVRVILSGKTESLKPNSGQAVNIGEHHICVGFHEETGSDYRVWEWHGHIMLFDEENGYTPEYIYGNYFERLLLGKPGARGRTSKVEKDEEDEEEKEEEILGNLGLRELIDRGDSSGAGRILHRNINAGGSPRFC